MKVQELRTWLEQFPDEADVEYKMDCFHGTVQLYVTLSGKDLGSTLDLDGSCR